MTRKTWRWLGHKMRCIGVITHGDWGQANIMIAHWLKVSTFWNGRSGVVLQRHTRIVKKLSGEGDGINLLFGPKVLYLTFEPEGP